MALRLLCMPAQIIQMMTFAQIRDMWRPGRSMEDHLKHYDTWLFQIKKCQIYERFQEFTFLKAKKYY